VKGPSDTMSKRSKKITQFGQFVREEILKSVEFEKQIAFVGVLRE